ncbi:hypothetical protein [Pseudomonas soli]|uniref:hypothetical protein n=1 Tax=Pseudomonas soli TaxID=1306993 RepID=UPI003815F938
MSAVKISISTVGHMPAGLNVKKIKDWSSSVFEICGEIENYSLSCQSDGHNWEFSDAILEKALPQKINTDFSVLIVNVPIQENWYARRLSSNRVVFSLYQIKDILSLANIPLENSIFRLLYGYTLLYRRNGNRIPLNSENTNHTHHETRGCLYDMNGIKSDIIHSCHKPIICTSCIEKISQQKVSTDTIKKCQAEIQKIQKILFYRIADFIKQHPLRSLAFSVFAAVFLGIIGSLSASFIYDWLK